MLANFPQSGIERIEIPSIDLSWSAWYQWHLLVRKTADSGLRAPEKRGVYEARYADSEDRLHIGRASDLGRRVNEGLVRGRTAHDAGASIRTYEDVSRVVVRWALTNRPCAVEEELHARHQARFGHLPKYEKNGRGL